MFNAPIIIIDFREKDTNTNGSYLRLNTAATGNDWARAWTEIRFANSGNTVQYSPKSDIDTRSGHYHWLGAFTEYVGKARDDVRLWMSSYTWNGDDVAGTWDYR